jgi:Pvc16 N-terminal domain
MSSPFALAAVSAVLRRLIMTGLDEVDLSTFGNIQLTTHPPDFINTGINEVSQLNLFLYQATPNISLRNMALPSRSASNERLTNPPLALDLHYLLTAYGSQELHREALLGYAMHILHEVPVLSRDFIRNTWPNGGNDPVEEALSAANLAEQIEQIKITPQTMNPGEMSNLWQGIGAKYRLSMAYVASVVLIESTNAAKSPLPVLKRGKEDTGPNAVADLIPPFPEIDTIKLPFNQPAALLEDEVEIGGHDFAGESGDPTQMTVTVRLQHARLPVTRDLQVPASDRTASNIKFEIPPQPADTPAGVYTMSILVAPNGQPDETRTSNEAPLLIAPKIETDLSVPLARVNVVDDLGELTVNLTCVPHVRTVQRVSLILGHREVLATQPLVEGADVSFHFDHLAAGEYWVRLRVDGVDSLLVDRSDPKKLKFNPTQRLTIT